VIEPALRDDAFLADVAEAEGDAGAWHLWWLGQSGFLLAAAGRRVLLDPYLSDTLTAKYAGTERQHVRMTARVVDPGRLTGIDLITASHGHTDHLDPGTLGPLLDANPDAALVVPEAERELAAERAGVPRDRPIGLDDADDVEPAGISVTALPSAHETVERDEAGRCRFLGYVVRLGGRSLYHPGDTVRYGGQAERLAGFGVDVAVLPINGADPARGVAGNLDGPEAARLARVIGAGLAIPCHYEMFAFNTASPEPFAAEARRLGQPVRILRAGERLTLR
jgi:L-ascorbate metabolism protein UlaG (beta-lactamase superfamily)